MNKFTKKLVLSLLKYRGKRVKSPFVDFRRSPIVLQLYLADKWRNSVPMLFRLSRARITIARVYIRAARTIMRTMIRERIAVYAANECTPRKRDDGNEVNAGPVDARHARNVIHAPRVRLACDRSDSYDRREIASGPLRRIERSKRASTATPVLSASYTCTRFFVNYDVWTRDSTFRSIYVKYRANAVRCKFKR